jgi:hypothetical protein
LTDAVEQRIRTALGIDAGAQLLWHGYLWNRDERRLQTAFGRCPWSAAAETFEYGRGVAGHAFRTCQPASYFSSEKKRSLICLLPEGVEPEWIVAVPILLSKDGPAVGVVEFSGSGNADADRELRDYAQRMAIRGEPSYVPSAAEQDHPTVVASRLFPAITAAFWDELPKRIKGLVAQADVDEADRVYSYWRQVLLASTTA